MSFPRYPSYRNTGVHWLGEVPANWEVKPLKAVASHNDEVLEESTAPEREILYVDISGVDAGSGIREKVSLRFHDAPSRARRLVRDGDVIISTVRTYLKAIARIHLPEDNLVVSTGFAVVRPRPGLNASFLGYALSGAGFLDAVISRSTGVSYPAINASDLVSLPLGLPPLAEQEAIAAFLDRETAKLDALVAEQERLIESLNEKRQAVISHVVTKGLNPNAPMKDSGIEWLGKIPAHWSVPPVYTRYNQALGKMLDEGKMTGEHPTPYLRNVDVRWDRFNIEDLPVMDIRPDEAERFMVRKGDLLMVEGRELGRSAIWDGADHIVAFQKALHRLRPLDDTEHPRFFYYTMVFANGVGVFFADQSPNEIPHLTGEQLRQHRFPKPPISEQISIIEALDQRTRAIDALTVECERATTLLQERRAALISAAVTGQIDVRPDSVRAAA